MRELLILIPTYNRAESIKFYIEKVMDSLILHNIDILICDSSSDEMTEDIVRGYIEKSEGHLCYKRYPSDMYEEKIFRGIDEIKDDYNYLWLCSDSYVLNIDDLYPDIKNYIESNIDIIHIDELDKDKIGNKQYHDCIELFRDCFPRMLLYGGTIINRRLFNTILNQEIFEKYTGTGLYYQASLMEYCACHSFSAVRYYNKRHYIINPYKTKSEWAGRAVWQWSENWYKVIISLPNVYNEYKPEVLKSSGRFSFAGLVRFRYYGGLTIKEVRKYKKYINETSTTNIAIVYLMCLVPVSMISIPRKLYRLCKSTWKNI